VQETVNCLDNLNLVGSKVKFLDSETSRQSLILFMAATQEEFSLDEGKATVEEAYADLQRKNQDFTRPYDNRNNKIWLLQQTLLLSNHRSNAEVLECLGLSLALSPPLNGWWFKTFMLPGDAVPIIRGERDNILPECTEIDTRRDDLKVSTEWRKRQSEAHADMVNLRQSYIIAQQYEPPYKGYQYKSLSDDKSVLKLVKSTWPPSRRVFNEQIVNDAPSLVHFDFDCTFKNESLRKDPYKFAQKFQAQAQKYVTDLFWEYYETEVKNVDMRILQAHRFTKDKQKFSLHIIIPGLKFNNLGDRLLIGKCMEDYKLKYIEKKGDWAQSRKGMMICKWVDCTIYSQNRMIRMAENCKAGEPNSHLKYHDDEHSKKWPDNEDGKFYASLLTRSENLCLAKSLRFPQPKHNIFIDGKTTRPCRKLKDFEGERYNLRFAETMKYIVSTQECVYEKLRESLKRIPGEWQGYYGCLAVSKLGLKVLHKALLDERKREAIKNIKIFIKENNVFHEHLRQSEDEIKYQIDDKHHGVLRRVLKRIKRDFKSEPVRQRPPRAMAVPSINEVKKLLKRKWPQQTPKPREVPTNSTIFNILGCYCHIHKRFHSGNNQYVTWTVKPSFISIKYKCHHVDKGDSNKQSISLWK
jgi:hypothetical protein